MFSIDNRPCDHGWKPGTEFPVSYLAFPVSDLGSHASFFSSDFSPSFSCFLCSHLYWSPIYSSRYFAIVPDFPPLKTGECSIYTAKGASKSSCAIGQDRVNWQFAIYPFTPLQIMPRKNRRTSCSESLPPNDDKKFDKRERNIFSQVFWCQRLAPPIALAVEMLKNGKFLQGNARPGTLTSGRLFQAHLSCPALELDHAKVARSKRINDFKPQRERSSFVPLGDKTGLQRRRCRAR